MKTLTGLLLLVSALLFVPPLAHAGGNNLIGTLPDKAQLDTAPGGTSTKVKPGESKCNGDGVCVDNKSKRKKITMTPGEGKGDASSETTVNTPTGADSDISGIDGNDTVTLGSSNTGNISGTGGTVNVSGGSTVTVTCDPGTGSTPITVNVSGTTITVNPGSSVDIAS